MWVTRGVFLLSFFYFCVRGLFHIWKGKSSGMRLASGSVLAASFSVRVKNHFGTYFSQLKKVRGEWQFGVVSLGSIFFNSYFGTIQGEKVTQCLWKTRRFGHMEWLWRKVGSAHGKWTQRINLHSLRNLLAKVTFVMKNVQQPWIISACIFLSSSSDV